MNELIKECVYYRVKVWQTVARQEYASSIFNTKTCNLCKVKYAYKFNLFIYFLTHMSGCVCDNNTWIELPRRALSLYIYQIVFCILQFYGFLVNDQSPVFSPCKVCETKWPCLQKTNRSVTICIQYVNIMVASHQLNQGRKWAPCLHNQLLKFIVHLTKHSSAQETVWQLSW